jgi:hypothetical protein
VESRHCQALARAAAWLIAITADPARGLSDAPSAPVEGSGGSPIRSGDSEPGVSTRPSPPDDVPSPAPATLANQPKPRTTSVRLPRSAHGERADDDANAPLRRRAATPALGRVGAFGGVWGAGLPRAQGTLGIRLGVAWKVLYLEARYAYALPRSVALAQEGDAQFRAHLLGLALCPMWGARLRAGPCATLTGVRSQGSASDLTMPQTDTRYWLGAGMSAALYLRVWGPLEVAAETGFELAVSPRPRFSVQGIGEVAQASLVSGYARFGFNLQIR